MELRARDILGIFSCIINANYHRTNLHCYQNIWLYHTFHSTNNVFTVTTYDTLYWTPADPISSQVWCASNRTLPSSSLSRLECNSSVEREVNDLEILACSRRKNNWSVAMYRLSMATAARINGPATEKFWNNLRSRSWLGCLPCGLQSRIISACPELVSWTINISRTCIYSTNRLEK